MSKSSTALAKTLAEFKKVPDIIASLEKEWRPSNAALTVAYLTAYVEKGQPLLDALVVADKLDKLKTAERQAAYNLLNPLITRALRAAMNSKVGSFTIDMLVAIKDKITGYNISKDNAKRETLLEKAKAKLVEGETLPQQSKPRSVSELEFEERFQNFNDFIVTLDVSGQYSTNIDDLTIAGLTTFKNFLAAADKGTQEASDACEALENTCAALFGGEIDSYYAINKELKNEVWALEGSKGTTYKLLTALKIPPIRK